MTEIELQDALGRADLTACERAVVILWSEAQNGSPGLTTYGLSKKMKQLRLGNPNRARLERDLKRSPEVITVRDRFQIKVGRTEQIRKLIGDFEDRPIVDLSLAYIPEQIWMGTRGYVEKVAIQLCGCWQQKFYDAAAVMLRRLAETLIIEAYEKLGRGEEVKDQDQNYFMLGSLVDRSCGANGIGLGREAKAALREIKENGDRSGHNRRANAVRPELERIRSGARTAVEELIYIAELKH
jgi:hypothetical protein